jgi:hypothetical protein
MPNGYTVACYYFGNYHLDARNEQVHGPGWNEWELVKRAEPRFPGHRQPHVPEWGFEDESDPAAMAKKIDAAADHGVDAWIFDWYWYDDGPFLERSLDRGFMAAPNNARIKFGLMWANHDWVDIHPIGLSTVRQPKLLYGGTVTRKTFDTVVEHVIADYFRHPSYWLIDGCPYFSIYELMKLREGLGGIEATRDALAHFRARVKAAGFPDLHLNAVVWSASLLPGETMVKDPNELLSFLGFNSITSYVWVHHNVLREFPATDYNMARDRYLAYWEEAERGFTLPYHPNVTMGWDSSVRTIQSDRFLNAGYPFTPVLQDNTPARLRDALAITKARLAARPEADRILTINAWNEWTESSYLEPDTVHGMGYLEAIRAVFGAAG